MQFVSHDAETRRDRSRYQRVGFVFDWKSNAGDGHSASVRASASITASGAAKSPVAKMIPAHRVGETKALAVSGENASDLRAGRATRQHRNDFYFSSVAFEEAGVFRRNPAMP
ncbi:hypothetical protein [Bradyrhizobium sp.]|uniref:hypothetical protein n=1 Tax=Bradyrhizobium sp. TaxID=376 RepID=UPI003C531574